MGRIESSMLNEIEALKAERDHWKANHDNQVTRMQLIRQQWRHRYGEDVARLLMDRERDGAAMQLMAQQRDSADETCKLLLNQLNDQTNVVNAQAIRISNLTHDLEEMRTRKDTTPDEQPTDIPPRDSDTRDDDKPDAPDDPIGDRQTGSVDT